MPILTARFDSLLSQLSQSTLNIDCESSSFQHQLDHTFSNATAQLTDVRTIVPMLAGSFAYSLFRSGSLAFMGSSLPSHLIAPVLGLMGEVTVFEWVGHGLRGEVPINRDPTRSDVLVEPSFMKAWFHSFVNFGLLKLGGLAGSNQNIFIQHLMQDSAMVAGNYATAALRLSERPTGSLFEQALHAEMTNIQLGFSMMLAHRFMPRIQAYERIAPINRGSTNSRQSIVEARQFGPLSSDGIFTHSSLFQSFRNFLSDVAFFPLWMMMGAGGIGGGSFFRSRTNRLAQRVTVPDSSQRVIAFEMESTEQVRELEETSENSFALRMRTLRGENLFQQSISLPVSEAGDLRVQQGGIENVEYELLQDLKRQLIGTSQSTALQILRRFIRDYVAENDAREIWQAADRFMKKFSDYIPTFREIVVKNRLFNQEIVDSASFGRLGLSKEARKKLVHEMPMRTFGDLVRQLERISHERKRSSEIPHFRRDKIKIRRANTPIENTSSSSKTIPEVKIQEPQPVAEKNQTPSNMTSRESRRERKLREYQAREVGSKAVIAETELSKKNSSPETNVFPLAIPPPKPSLEGRTLSALLENQIDPDLLFSIERYLRADPNVRLRMLPPLRKDLESLAHVLGKHRNSAQIERSLQQMQEVLREPDVQSVCDFNLSMLDEMTSEEEAMISSLSENAQQGLYLSFLALSEKGRNNLRWVLTNPELQRREGGVENIFSSILLLYHLGVRGYEHGFLEDPRNSQLLSNLKNHLSGIIHEYGEAFRYARSSEVHQVWMGAHLKINWEKLDRTSQDYLDREVIPLLENPHYDYRAQQSVKVDFLYRDREGSRRLVEVKRSKMNRYHPSESESAQMILQLYRHALLVSQHRLAGLEYVFSAPSVDSNWISRIRTVLQTLQIPFLLRINHLRENREEIIEEGLTALNLSHLDESRVRVIPSIPEWGLKKILGRVAEGIENNQRDLSESMDDSLNPETSLSRYRGIQETFHAARQFIEEQLDQRIHSLDALSDLARDMSSEERLSALEELSVDTPFEFVSSERQAPVSLRQLLYAIERGDLNQTPLSIELRIRRIIELFDAVQSQIDLLDE